MTAHTRNDDDDEWHRGFFGGDPADPDPDHSVDHPIGYKNPPEVHKWKKGQSGNPSGRRKAPPIIPVPGLLEAIAFEMAKEIEVGSNGKKSKMAIAQVVAKRLTADLLSSDPLIRLKTMNVLARMGMGDAVQAVFNHQALVSAANDKGWHAELEAAYQLIEREFLETDDDNSPDQV